MKLIVGMYDDAQKMAQALSPMLGSDVRAESLEIMMSKDAKQRSGSLEKLNNSVRTVDKDLDAMLKKRGIPSSDVDFYTRGVQNGHSLLLLQVDDDRAARIAGALQGKGMMTPQTHKMDTDKNGKIEVIQEDIKVGKQVVEKGGARVEKKVSTKTVEKPVTLREEEVKVKRTPVDRPATDAEMRDAFTEGSVELTERAEEAVVQKQARVVEEVEVGKQVKERKEVVREQVRRVDVDIKKLDAHDTARFSDHLPTYKKHYDSKLKEHGSFDDFEPAFRYGHGYAAQDDYRGKPFRDVEPHMRGDYEARYGERTWNDKVRTAAQHAYDNTSKTLQSS